ncbi:MAG TPA: polyketide synthase dehydratase domain-containing protein, partial [Myxococcota bacterium]|nr:polyketide synthase dehydratase domain-containing protein [Myxococcota bacterium]
VEAPPAHPLLVERADSPDPSWTARVDGARWSWLRDHHVGGAAVIPGALWLEAMLAATQQGRDESQAVLTDVRFFAALVLGSPGEIQELRSSLVGDRVQVHARTAAGGTQENWRLHAEARVQPAARWAPPTALDAAALEALCPDSVSVDSLYHNLDQRGLCYGPAFRGICGLQRGDSDVLAEVTTTSSLPFYVNPAQLDAAFQALLALRPDDPHTLMPVGIGRVQLLQPPAPGPWKVHGHIREDQGDHIVGDLHFRDAEGRVFLAILGLRCQRLAREVLPERWWHQPRWEAAAPENPSAGTLWRVPVVKTTELSDLVKELLHRVRTGTKDLVVVTQNAWSVGGFPAQNPAHAALWGTGRVVMTEQPQLRLRLLDVDEDQPDDRLLSAIGSEEEAALRGGQRYVARLHRARTDGLPPEGQRGAAG